MQEILKNLDFVRKIQILAIEEKIQHFRKAQIWSIPTKNGSADHNTVLFS